MNGRIAGKAIFVAIIGMIGLMSHHLIFKHKGEADSFSGKFLGITDNGLLVVEDKTNKLGNREILLAWTKLTISKNAKLREDVTKRFKGTTVKAVATNTQDGWIVFVEDFPTPEPKDLNASDSNMNIKTIIMGKITETNDFEPGCIKTLKKSINDGAEPRLSISCLGDPENGESFP